LGRCSATGFNTATFPLMSAFCNAYLSIYFCLKVRNRWKTDDSQSVEKMAFAFMLVLPLSSGKVGAATHNVNPQYFVDICYYGASPQGAKSHSEIASRTSCWICCATDDDDDTSFDSPQSWRKASKASSSLLQAVQEEV
jgi:hypothetical protein